MVITSSSGSSGSSGGSDGGALGGSGLTDAGFGGRLGFGLAEDPAPGFGGRCGGGVATACGALDKLGFAVVGGLKVSVSISS